MLVASLTIAIYYRFLSNFKFTNSAPLTGEMQDNNDSEFGARVEKGRQDVSLHTISKAGTTAKDAFLTITQTAKKLGVNAFQYINDRVSTKFRMPALSDLIVENARPQLV